MSDPYEEQTYSLPPEFQQKEPRIYGNLFVTIGKLAWINPGTKTENTKIRIKFWGDRGSGQLVKPSNAGKELGALSSTFKYDVRCPIQNFHRYLQDSEAVRLYMLDPRNEKPLGVVTINMNYYLKNKLEKNEQSPFRDILGIFPVEKLQTASGKDKATGERIGEIELRIFSLFEKQENGKFQKPDLQKTSEIYNSLSDQLKFLLAKDKADKEKKEEDDQFDFLAEKPKENKEPNLPIKLPKHKDDFKYKADLFRGPQDISSVDDSDRIKPVQIFNVENKSQNSVTSMYQIQPKKPIVTEYDENKFDSQIDQLILKSKSLHKNMISSEKNEHVPKVQPKSIKEIVAPVVDSILNPKNPEPDYFEPSIPFNDDAMPKIDFDKDAMNRSTELEKLRLYMEEAAFLDFPEMGEDGEFTEVQDNQLKEKKEESLHFSQIDSLKVDILELSCGNEYIRRKLHAGKVQLECFVPNTSSTSEKPTYDSYKFFAKDSGNRVWTFNNEIFQRVLTKEGEFSKLVAAVIQFKIFVHEEYKDAKNVKKFTTELAQGVLSIENLVRAPGFCDTYYVKLITKQQTNAPKAAAKRDPAPKATANKKGGKGTAQKDRKSPSPEPVRFDALTNDFGDLKVVLKFCKSKEKMIQYEQQQQEVVSSKSYNPLQMLAYFERIPKIIARDEPKMSFRSIYIAYKIYGTNEKVTTDIRYRTNTPYIDHRMLFPVSVDHISKMDTLPFIVEVWDKIEGARDKLLGLVKIDLSHIYRAIYDPEHESINYEFINNNQYPILITDDTLPIIDLKEDTEVGRLKLVLALGNPLQINKFETKIQEKREGYVELHERAKYNPTGLGVPSKGHYFKDEDKSQPSDRSRFREPRREEPESSDVPKTTVEKIAEAADHFDEFRNFLDNLRKFGDENSMKSSNFWKSEKFDVSLEEFVKFFSESKYGTHNNKLNKVFNLLDVEENNWIYREDIINSYSSYILIERAVRNKAFDILSNIIKLMQNSKITTSKLEKTLLQNTQSGFLSKQQFKKRLNSLKVLIGSGSLNYLIDLYWDGKDDHININSFLEALKSVEREKDFKKLSVSFKSLLKETIKVITEKLVAIELSEPQLEIAFSSIDIESYLNIRNLTLLFAKLGLDINFWEGLCLIISLQPEDFPYKNELFLPGQSINDWIYEIHNPTHPEPEAEEEDQIDEVEGEDGEYDVPTEEEDAYDADGNQIQIRKSGKSSPSKDLRSSVKSEDELIDILNPNLKNRNQAEAHEDEEFDNQAYDQRDNFYGGGGAYFNHREIEETISNAFEKFVPKKKELDPDEFEANLLRKLQANLVQTIDSKLEEKFPKPEVKEFEEDRKALEQKLNRRILKHKLTISIQNISQLVLNQNYNKQNIFLKTIVPSIFEAPESNLFEYNVNNREYDFQYQSKHVWTLHRTEDLLEYLKNSFDGILVQIARKEKILDEVIGYAIIPFEEIDSLMKSARTYGLNAEKKNEILKSFLLIKSPQSDSQLDIQNELVIGKIRAKIEYQSEHPLDDEPEDDTYLTRHKVMQNETTVYRVLHKKGFINFNFKSISELKKGLNYALETNKNVSRLLSGKGDFKTKLAVYVNLFKDDEELSKTFLPFEYEIEKDEINFNELVLDAAVSKEISLTPEVLNYFPNGAALVEVRLYIVEEGKPLENPIPLCNARVPLLQLLASPAGLQGDFALVNQVKYYSGLISLEITFDGNSKQRVNVGRKVAEKIKREKQTYFFMIGINEVISLPKSSENGDNKQIIFFEYEVEGEIKRTLFYHIDKKSPMTVLSDGYFNFTIESTSDFFKKPLEIKVYEKSKSNFQDQLIGVSVLDFYYLQKKHLYENKTCFDSFYLSVADPQNTKHLKMRIGLRLSVVRIKNQEEGRKLNRYLREFMDSDPKSKNLEVFKTLDTKGDQTIAKKSIRTTLKSDSMTVGELEELLGLISGTDDVNYGIFLHDIRPELHQGLSLEPELWNELMREFNAYDSTQEGYVDFEHAKKIATYFSKFYGEIEENYLKLFTIENDRNGLLLGFPTRVCSKFDYLNFASKIQFLNVQNEYKAIFEKTRKVDSYLHARLNNDQNLDAREAPLIKTTKFTDFSLKLDLVSGRDLQKINKGVAPNSFVRVFILPNHSSPDASSQLLESFVISRSSDPEFNVSNSFSTTRNKVDLDVNQTIILFQVYHRSYNSEHTDQLHKLALIGTGKINLADIIQDEKIFFNGYVELEPTDFQATKYKKGGCLKVKISGDVTKINIPESRIASDKKFYNSSFGVRQQTPVAFEEPDEDVIDLNDRMLENFTRTLAEINYGLESIQKSKKIEFEDE